MGVYIKGLNKKDISDLRVHKYGGAYEFVEHEDIIEIKTPHGRLVDEDDIHTGIRMEKNTEYRYFIDRVNAPTVIESEVE